jgi:hypothetical protein
MFAKSALLTAMLVLASLDATTTHAAQAGGLRGVVTRSPIMPVCMEGVPCSAPAKNTVLVFHRTGSDVRTRTDDTGRYRVALAPGTWNVSATRRVTIGSGITPRSVRVVAGRVRVVNFDIDTGIR